MLVIVISEPNCWKLADGVGCNGYFKPRGQLLHMRIPHLACMIQAENFQITCQAALNTLAARHSEGIVNTNFPHIVDFTEFGDP